MPISFPIPGKSNSSTADEIQFGGKDLSYIRELATKMSTGTAEEQLEANMEFEIISRQLDQKGKSNLDDFVSDVIAESIAKSTKDEDLKSEQRKLIRGVVSGQAGMGLIKTGAGLLQVIDAAAKKKNLRMPDMPDTITKNKTLANELSKSLSRQEQGDTALQRYFDERIAEQRRVGEERAKTSGNIGQYLAGSQAAQYRANQATRDFAEDESRRKERYRGETSNLLSQSMNEDDRIQDDLWRRFGAEESRFRESSAALQAQQNSGYENIFAGLGDLVQNSTLLGYIGRNSVNRPGSPIVDPSIPAHLNQDSVYYDGLAQSIIDDPNPFGTQSGVRPTISPIDESGQMSELEMIMLGNSGMRTKDRIKRFQESMNGQGVAIENTGQWDSATEEMFNIISDPLNFNLKFTE